MLVGDDGAVLGRASVPIRCAYPHPGWVEQDAEEIWQSVLTRDRRSSTRRTRSRSPTSASPRSSGTARPAPSSPVIGWQDARTAPDCDRLREHEPLVRARTGLALDPMFSATKLHWLLDGRDDLCAGTIDAFLIHRLTGEFAIEAGNASRTLLMNLETLAGTPSCASCSASRCHTLPEIRRSDAGFGEHRGVPVTAVLADSHAALYAHGAAKATYGTGSSVMVPSERRRSTASRTRSRGSPTRPTYAVEGNILASAAALDWMARTLRVDAPRAARARGGHRPTASTSSRPSAASARRTGTATPAAVIAGLTLGTTPRAPRARGVRVRRPPDLRHPRPRRARRAARRRRRHRERPADAAPGRPRGLPGARQRPRRRCPRSASPTSPPARRPRSGRHATFDPAISDDERHTRREAWHAAVRRSRMATPELEESLR